MYRCRWHYPSTLLLPSLLEGIILSVFQSKSTQHNLSASSLGKSSHTAQQQPHRPPSVNLCVPFSRLATQQASAFHQADYRYNIQRPCFAGYSSPVCAYTCTSFILSTAALYSAEHDPTEEAEQAILISPRVMFTSDIRAKADSLSRHKVWSVTVCEPIHISLLHSSYQTFPEVKLTTVQSQHSFPDPHMLWKIKVLYSSTKFLCSEFDSSCGHDSTWICCVVWGCERLLYNDLRRSDTVTAVTGGQIRAEAAMEIKNNHTGFSVDWQQFVESHA